ncbi:MULTISPECIES: hypothetical protein [Methylotenera]|uniref:hypothetical protein n=1 Tax=Methylotenera TaxID=359407 RepID=UPI001E2DBB78|nr:MULTISPECIES: hypothetical protein [Methylotenera]
MYKIALILIAFFLSSCGATMKSQFGPLPEVTTQNVSIIDNRPIKEKEYLRPSMLGVVQILGDNNFDPSIVNLFSSTLEKESASSGKKYQISIERLRVIDQFRVRRGFDEPIKEDFEVVGFVYTQFNITNSDFVVFQFAGTVNGRSVNLQAAHPYKASNYSTNIFNDESFKSAVRKTVADVALKITNL